MSIVALLAAAEAAATPTEKPAGAGLVLFALWSIASIVTIFAARVFRRPFANAPARWDASDTVGVLLGIALAGFAASILGAIPIYPFVMFMPEPQRNMAAAMLAGVVTFAVVVILNAAIRQDGLKRLGLGRNVRGGLVAGFTGFFIILPWVFWVMFGVAELLNRMKVHVPTEHPIFQMWQSSGRAFHVLAYVAAVFIAPLAEESLFRGMVQTTLVRMFTPTYRPPGLFFPPPPPPQPAAPSAELPGQVPSYSPPPPAPVSALARWMAIIIASLIFASIHRPASIQPPIFLLALALGYVYERTGNLWSCIFMHMLFNAFEFTLFLL